MGGSGQKKSLIESQSCGPPSREHLVISSFRCQIEKVPPCFVFDFNDPGIRIESNFSRKTLFDRLFGDRLG